VARKALSQNEVAGNRERRLRELWDAWPAPKPSKEAFTRFGRHGKVASRRAAYVAGRVRDGAEVLGISRGAMTGLVMRSPQILGFTPQMLRRYAEGSAALLGMSVDMYLRAVVVKEAHILYWNPAKLAAKVDMFAGLLGLARAQTVELVRRRPNLLLMAPSSVARKARETADILRISFADLVAVAERHPQVLYQSPALTGANVALSSRYLEVPEAAFIRAVLRCPQLISSRPGTLAAKAAVLRELCAVLEVGFAEVLERHPVALMYGMERLTQRLTMAREGLGTRNIVSLLSMAASRADALLRLARGSEAG